MMRLTERIHAPELIGDQWINSRPLTMSELRGRVVLIDFWDYTCVNCLRTQPYLNEWYNRYANYGLVIIGIHTPEFSFAGNYTNVENALQRLKIKYPVLLDNNYKNWSAYANRYWPSKYLIDEKGYIVYDHTGEGAYGEVETLIQRLLWDIDSNVKLPPVMEPAATYDMSEAVCIPATPEMYCGYLRGVLGNPEGYIPEATADFTDPRRHLDGHLYLSGKWYCADEYVRHAGGTDSFNDYALIKYHSFEVNAVINPMTEKAFDIIVTRDGKPVPRDDMGFDIRYKSDGQSFVHVNEPRMYRIVSNATFGSHELKLATDSDGMGLYSFTFRSCGSL